MKYTGKIIALAYPDTFVKGSTELICKLLPYVGLGTKHYIKAGHAALLLVDNETGAIRYFDFGRYVTPPGYGRVRSAETDAELEIPFKALFDAEGSLNNVEEVLRWLDANPHRTHGNGRLLASVCDTVDYKKAETYILNLQARGSIPYGVFEKEGSNCSRLVAETLLESTDATRIIKRLKFNKLFTPSTVGNVEIAATNGVVFEVLHGVVNPFSGSAFKENLTNYFDKKNVPTNRPDRKKMTLDEVHVLEGIGSSAYFKIVSSSLPKYHYRIQRFNEYCELDFDGVYVCEKFDVNAPYSFTYDSHCKYCHVLQNDKRIKMLCVGEYSKFNSSKKVHSA